MTPDLMEEGTQALARAQARPTTGGESGGRAAAYGRVVQPGQLDLTHGSILYLDDIEVSFDGFKALNKLSLDISVGEMRCIIGPNGAGKTTFFNAISGVTKPTSGTLTVQGRELGGKGPHFLVRHITVLVGVRVIERGREPGEQLHLGAAELAVAVEVQHLEITQGLGFAFGGCGRWCVGIRRLRPGCAAGCDPEGEGGHAGPGGGDVQNGAP